MKKKNTICLVLNIGVPLLLSLGVYLVSKSGFSYLETLNRNIVIPPVVFGIVWPILYVLMGIWISLYSRDFPEDKKTKIIYWISLVINLLFNIILFSSKQILSEVEEICKR